MVIGKTRTNQPVEGDNDALALSLTGKDIAPKDVNATGKVSGNEIIENMSGYSVNLLSPAGYTIEGVYAGAVKNGNKLTLVLAFNITKTSDATDPAPYVVYFGVPSAIANKLYPTQIGVNNVLDAQTLRAYSSLTVGIDFDVWLEKSSNTLMLQVLAENLVEDTKYFVRYEGTFLLSDNLIPQE